MPGFSPSGHAAPVTDGRTLAFVGATDASSNGKESRWPLGADERSAAIPMASLSGAWLGELRVTRASRWS